MDVIIYNNTHNVSCSEEQPILILAAGCLSCVCWDVHIDTVTNLLVKCFFLFLLIFFFHLQLELMTQLQAIKDEKYVYL